MDFSLSDLNFNSVETLQGFEVRAAFTVNSAPVFKEDVDIVPTIVDFRLRRVSAYSQQGSLSSAVFLRLMQPINAFLIPNSR